MPSSPNGWFPPLSPFASHEERLVTEALEDQLAPAEEVRTLRPPLAIDPFPPRFGYRQWATRIDDVVKIDRFYQDRRIDYSGVGGSYMGSPRWSSGFGV